MDEGNRLFRFRMPKWSWVNSASTRTAGVYFAGALFSLALFVLVDATMWSHSHLNGSPNLHLNFVDWIPAIFSFLGLVVINSIDKARLAGDSFYSGDSVAWQARVVLFMGFAAMAGGLAGGISVMVLKYVTQGATSMGLWLGVSNLVTNALVMLSSVVLWVSQNMEDDYTYNLSL